MTLPGTARRPGRVAAFLAAALAVVAGLLGAGPASAATPTYAYDSVAYTYDASLNLSTAHATVASVRGPPAGSVAVSWARSASVRDRGVAANTVTNIGGHSLDDLSRAGASIDRNGLSGAGRALQKHGDRPGSVFPSSTGTAAERSAQGQVVLDDILTNPGSTNEVLDNVINVWDPSGRGARFGTNGSFMGFLEPRG